MSVMFWIYCEMEAEDINLVSLACGHSPLLVTEPLWWTRPTTFFLQVFLVMDPSKNSAILRILTTRTIPYEYNTLMPCLSPSTIGLVRAKGGFKSNSCLTNSPPLAMTPPLLSATKADKSRFKYTLAFYQVIQRPCCSYKSLYKATRN